VKIITDLAHKTFSLETKDIDPYYDYVDLKFSFSLDGNTEVEFNNLSFGYSVFFEDFLLGADTYPKNNIEYISNGQDYLELSRVFGFRPNRNYEIEIVVNHSEESFSANLSFEVPKLDQPYKSWIWNDELIKWEAPIAFPEDGNFYTWNEETQSWDIFIPEEES